MAAKKKAMKMMRSDGSQPGKDAVAIDEVQFTSNKMGKTSSGAVVVMDEQATLEADVGTAMPKKARTEAAKASMGMSGVIAVNAPDEEMEEVKFADFDKTQESALTQAGTSAAKSATEIVRDLIGGSATKAKEVLEEMHQKKLVSSYRFVPIGQPMTMEVAPGRVQVLIDAAKRVIDIQIS